MADNINFLTIGVPIRRGGFFLEIDHTHAVTGPTVMPRKLLLLGQRLPTGNTPALTPVRVVNEGYAIHSFGQGSMLHKMSQAVDKVKKLYGLVDVYAVALDDFASGTEAKGTVTITGTVDVPGIFNLYVGGELVRSQASLLDDATAVATKLAAAINANADLPVTALATAGVVTVTARHKGAAFNALELATTYYETDTTVSGLSVTCANLSGGAGDPDVSDALAAIAGDWFYSIVCPYTDTLNLTSLRDDMDGRWGGINMKTGHVFNAPNGTFAELTTFGEAQNSPHFSSFGLKNSPTWGPVRAAALAATCEYLSKIDPAAPLADMEVPGVLPPRLKDRFDDDERELLLFSGISTTTVTVDNKILLERVITNYQKSTLGVPNESLLRLETKWTVDNYRYGLRIWLYTKFNRFKLADDGTNVAPGQKVATPMVIRAEIIAYTRLQESFGQVENVDEFKRELLVVRSEVDVDRINAIVPPDLINQFRTFAAAVQYKL